MKACICEGGSEGDGLKRNQGIWGIVTPFQVHLHSPKSFCCGHDPCTLVGLQVRRHPFLSRKKASTVFVVVIVKHLDVTLGLVVGSAVIEFKTVISSPAQVSHHSSIVWKLHGKQW